MDLSMAKALARTPDPTYGTPASSSSPWMVPSSPYGPCRRGKTTSTDARDAGTCPGACTTNSRFVGSPASTDNVA